jgi:hypothetical protein
MACEECTDENGEELFPQYGLAPHDHIVDKDGNIITTVFAPSDFYPDNFEPDPDAPNCGTWHCEFCYEKS